MSVGEMGTITVRIDKSREMGLARSGREIAAHPDNPVNHGRHDTHTLS